MAKRDYKRDRAGININYELHAEVLAACPEGYKKQAFIEALIRIGLEQIKKQNGKFSVSLGGQDK
jgi:hypothetical protein